MWTLKTYLEALAHLGPTFVAQEADGFAWPADELLDWLEWQTPERLKLAVGFSGPNQQGGGVLYALDDQGAVVGPGPLYWIVLRQARLPPSLSDARREDNILPLGEPSLQREQNAWPLPVGPTEDPVVAALPLYSGPGVKPLFCPGRGCLLSQGSTRWRQGHPPTDVGLAVQIPVLLQSLQIIDDMAGRTQPQRLLHVPTTGRPAMRLGIPRNILTQPAMPLSDLPQMMPPSGISAVNAKK